MNRIAILGSTGSIGRQTLDVARRLSGRVEVVALAANRNAEALLSQAAEWGVKHVGLCDVGSAASARNLNIGSGVQIYEGVDGLCELACLPCVDRVVVAVAGMIGLRPTLCAVESGKTIALASKEVLVAGGEFVMSAAKRAGVAILPVDSEHSAVFQCLQGVAPASLDTIVLTASGGPFRETPAAELSEMTAADALKHPTWKMGALVTVNSATLMNKGLEVIEAHWLFGLPVDRVEVIIHPQSIVHSLVRLRDGSILAQLGLPDMRLPIQYSLVYPERPDTGLPKLDLADMQSLTFDQPDHAKFPCLGLAYDAVRMGGTTPAALNGANEAVVSLFLAGEVGYGRIPELIVSALDAHVSEAATLESVLEADRWAREYVGRRVGALSS